MPEAPPDNPRPQPTGALRSALWKYLEKRQLLTTRHHVVGPDYVSVGLTAKLFLQDDARAEEVPGRAVKIVRDFFHPLTGGPDGTGWPFGRNVHVSEGYELLDKVPGVDYVEAVTLKALNDASREQHAADNSVIGITLHAHELVAMEVNEDSFEIE